MATRPGWVESRYQAMPPSSSASLIRSMTESKNAPRGEAVPDALATAPSSTSGTAVSTRSSRPARSEPLAMATAAATAMARPVTVRWLAVMPVRRMLAPIGRRPFSKVLRHRPSNMMSPGSASTVRRAGFPTLPNGTRCRGRVTG
jgi:hypothetical protein